MVITGLYLHYDKKDRPAKAKIIKSSLACLLLMLLGEEEAKIVWLWQVSKQHSIYCGD